MKRWLKISLWSLFAVGVIVLLVFTQKAQDELTLEQPEIHIRVEGESTFITSEEILGQLRRKRLLFDHQKSGELNVEKIESHLKGISQIKDVKVYKELGGHWKIDVSTRKPIARIYNKQGESYYLDDEGVTMKTSLVHASRILVVSGEIRDRLGEYSVPEIINNDSLKSILKLDDIYRISNYVCNDPLFHSLIGQIHLEKDGDFVLVPLVGDQKIIFGSAFSDNQVEDKFKKLRIFYKEAMPYEGWDKYSEVSLKYEDQIVCKKKKTDG
jgi:cell division protein FtsQ